MSTYRVGRPIALAVLMAAGLAGHEAVAQAQITHCRSDPVITLSTGVTFSLYEDVSADASTVTGIAYQLHLPPGVQVASVTYSGDVPAGLQTLTWASDDKVNTYDDSVKVSTTGGNYPMTAYAALGPTQSLSVNGHTNQSLSMHVQVK